MRATTASAAGADDHLLALLHVATQHFGRSAVAEPEREHDRRRLAARADDPDASSGAASRLAAGRRDLFVARLLLVGEDVADARALGFAEDPRPPPPLALRQSLNPLELLTAISKDRFQLFLLLLGQAEPLDEELAKLVGRGRTTARSRAGLRRGRRCGVDAGRAEPQGRVRHLERTRLLGDDQLHVGRHPRHESSRWVVDAPDYRVGTDVLDHLWCLADLRYGPREHVAGKRLDREGRAIIELEAPDVRFVHARLDLHLREVLRDGEE